MSDDQLTPYQLEKQRKREEACQRRLRRIELARLKLYQKANPTVDVFRRPDEGTEEVIAGTRYRRDRNGALRKIGPADLQEGHGEKNR